MDSEGNPFDELNKLLRDFEEIFLSGFIIELAKRIDKELIHGESEVNLKEQQQCQYNNSRLIFPVRTTSFHA